MGAQPDVETQLCLFRVQVVWKLNEQYTATHFEHGAVSSVPISFTRW
jgi:hypothetical protein